jgi:glycosyltransferase involved in cell wall biosynthesis
MDDQDTLRTYGNTNLPEGTEDRPLVTFALFAYNQEKYIREAVEGAFSQTYSPLEIILSDDSSSDRTFQIIREMAATYKGKHEVKVRQSKINRGLARHILDVAQISNGEFIVVAAGDDVSLPSRSAEMIDLLTEEGTKFGASNFNEVNEIGKLIEENKRNDYSKNYLFTIICSNPECFASGAAAVYRKEFLHGALQSARESVNSGRIYNEDMLFAAYAAAIDELPSNYTKGPLLNYRIVSTSLSNYKMKNHTFIDELSLVKREAFRSHYRCAILNAILEISKVHSSFSNQIYHGRVREDLERCKAEIAASDTKMLSRFKNFLNVRTARNFRISLPRLFGPHVLAWLRFLKRKIS